MRDFCVEQSDALFNLAYIGELLGDAGVNIDGLCSITHEGLHIILEVNYCKKGKIVNNKNIPFQTIDWSKIPKIEHNGETGIAYWQTLQFDGLRIRIVEYSAGYVADHWCEKGHIVHCLLGEVINEQRDGTNSVLTPGCRM